MPRVLVVDDSRVVLSIVQTYLMALRCEFDVASNGEEGLHKFRKHGADIVIVDIMLPGIDGRELARQIRAAAADDVKIVLISSAREADTADSLARGDVDAFLPKPLDGKKLQDVVAQLLVSLSKRQPSRRSLLPKGPISVVAADDTEVGRRVLERILKADPGFELVAVAHDGIEAVDMAVRHKPKIALLDALMPGLDGIAATRRIMEESPTRVVIVTEHFSSRGASTAFEAQQAGALELLPRPSWGDPDGPQAAAFRDRLKELAEIPVVRHRRRPTRTTSRRRTTEAPAIIGICASTGGPAVLATILPRLVPVLDRTSLLIVQHVLSGFDAALAMWLRDTTGLPLQLAADGDALTPGVALLAPDGRHMRVPARGRVEVVDSPPVNSHRPSGTPLFETLAHAYGSAALGVVLTGMGSDGIAGLRVLKHKGGSVLAQSPETCAVPGMPDAAIEAGLPDAVLPPEELADEIAARVGKLES